MKLKKSVSIDIFYPKDIDNFVKNVNYTIRKNAKTVRRQIISFRNYFFKYEEPHTEITQNSDVLFIKILLPMTKKKDIKLQITNNKVEVEGIFRRKGNICGFHRSLDLPLCTMPDKAKAVFKNEQLRIKIPLQRL